MSNDNKQQLELFPTLKEFVFEEEELGSYIAKRRMKVVAYNEADAYELATQQFWNNPDAPYEKFEFDFTNDCVHFETTLISKEPTQKLPHCLETGERITEKAYRDYIEWNNSGMTVEEWERKKN